VQFRDMLGKYTRTEGNVIVTDLRDVETIFPGNRFMVYALYPEQNVSIWIVDGRNKQNCVFACGRSIINRTATVDIGALMLKHGGGGHKAAGTCQVDYETSESALQDIIDTMNQQ
jgi:nanoRNase/pAp phosphatase (c-di-AMP/oligoRNAs hydrolase)